MFLDASRTPPAVVVEDVLFIRFEASLQPGLQPNTGFTFERALTVFTRSDHITPPKVNRF